MNYSNNNGFIDIMGDSDRNKAITIPIFVVQKSSVKSKASSCASMCHALHQVPGALISRGFRCFS